MISLERFGAADIERLLGWIGESEAALVQWAGPQFSHPLDAQQLRTHLAKANAPDSDSRVFKVLDGGRAIGHAELTRIDPREKTARFSRLLIGDESARGEGLGTRMIQALLVFAFDELGLREIRLGVYDFNHGAIRCYERLGFRRISVERDAMRVDGRPWNSIQMELRSQDWQRPASAP